MTSAKNEFDKTAQLFELLRTRVGSYNALLQSLLEDNQSGAYQLLSRALKITENKVETPSVIPIKYRNINLPIDAFLESTKSYLILTTLDCALTAEKMSLITDLTINEIEFSQIESTCPELLLEMLVLLQFTLPIRKTSIKTFLNVDNEDIVKRIIIAEKINDFEISHLETKLQPYLESATLAEDQFRWQDITDEYKVVLSKRTVLDQCRQVSLTDFFHTFVYANENELREKILNGKVLVELINNKFPVLCKHTVPAVNSYIPRKIVSRSTLEQNIFKDENSVFLIQTCGAEAHELHGLLGPHRPFEDQICRPSLTYRKIVEDMASETKFDDICKFATNQAIHLVRCNKKSSRWHITWIKSSPNLGKIQNFVAKHDQNVYPNESSFLVALEENTNHSVVCISDSPGMGKTLLLAKIAQTIITMFKDRLVAFVVLSEFVALVKKFECDDKRNNVTWRNVPQHEQVFRAIAAYVCDYETDGTLLQNRMNSCKLEILFDGLDEVKNEDMEYAFHCLKCIPKILKNCRMFITTRPHLLERLEAAFLTLGFNIKEFGREDQVDFLVAQWSEQRRIKKLPVDKQRLEKLTRHCLDSLKKTMSDTERSFAGVPLQCLLIGHVFKESLLKYADPEHEMGHVPTSMVYISSLTNLYKKMVDFKLSAYERRRFSGRKSDRKHIQEMHIYQAVSLLFPEKDWIPIFKNDVETSDDSESELLRIGLMASPGISNKKETPRFIHRTVAEYFAAVFAFKTIRNGSDSAKREFVFNTILYTEDEKHIDDNQRNQQNVFKYPVVCHFLDAILKQKKLVTFPEQCRLNVADFHQIRRICYSSIKGNLQTLFRLFISQIQPTEQDYQTMLSLAVDHSPFEFFELILQLKVARQNVKDMEEATFQKLFKRAATSGNLEVVSHLFYHKTPNNYEIESTFVFEMIYHCISNSTKDSKSTIENKIQIMKLLTAKCPGVLQKQDSKQRTPLLFPSVHLKILTALLDLGADITRADKTINTVVHKAAEYLSNEEFYTLLQHVTKLACTNVLFLKGKFGFTPLQSLIFYSEPSPETLKVFSEHNANFNQSCELGYTLLGLAISCEQNKACLQTLVEYGASWERVDKWGNSALHLAVKVGRKEAVQYFIDLFKAEGKLDIVDDFGNTPLHLSLWNDKEITALLISEGADVNAANNKGETLLHHGVTFGDIEKIKLIRQHMPSLDVRDKKQNTLLHHVLKTGVGNTFDVVQILKQQINEKNADGKSPLEVGLRKTLCDLDIRVLETLEPLVKEWNQETANMAFKHILTCPNWCYIINLNDLEARISKLADKFKGEDHGVAVLDELDEHGNTLLHIAAKNRNLSGVKYLVRNGCKISVHNVDGQTALEVIDCYRENKCNLLEYTMHCNEFHNEDLCREIVKVLLEAKQSSSNGTLNVIERIVKSFLSSDVGIVLRINHIFILLLGIVIMFYFGYFQKNFN